MNGFILKRIEELGSINHGAVKLAGDELGVQADAGSLVRVEPESTRALVPPRYRSTYFSHIWDSGYAAGYYAYLWSELIDDDAYAWFIEHGGLTRENGQRFRDMLLSRGGTEDAAAMYRAFRGRDPSIEPLLEQRGLKVAPATP